MPRSYGQLTGEQAEHFLERGFVTVRSAFDAASAQRWLDDAWIRFGYDRRDPRSWAEKRRSRVPACRIAPLCSCGDPRERCCLRGGDTVGISGGRMRDHGG